MTVADYQHDIEIAEFCQRTYSAPGLGDFFAFQPGEIDGLYTLCFRGTKSWLEWIADFVAFPLYPIRTVQDLRLGPIHAGFLEGANILRAQVAADVAGRPFALVGHSLGGALATVLAGLLTAAGTPPAEVVTFGAPRAGTDKLVALLQPVAIRQYVFGADPVPHLPSNPPFVHVRQPLLHLGKPLQSLFSNHHISNYISALEALYHGQGHQQQVADRPPYPGGHSDSDRGPDPGLRLLPGRGLPASG